MRCGAVRCGAVRHGAVRCGAVRCGEVRYSVRCGAAGHRWKQGAAWQDTAPLGARCVHACVHLGARRSMASSAKRMLSPNPRHPTPSGPARPSTTQNTHDTHSHTHVDLGGRQVGVLIEQEADVLTHRQRVEQRAALQQQCSPAGGQAGGRAAGGHGEEEVAAVQRCVSACVSKRGRNSAGLLLHAPPPPHTHTHHNHQPPSLPPANQPASTSTPHPGLKLGLLPSLAPTHATHPPGTRAPNPKPQNPPGTRAPL